RTAPCICQKASASCCSSVIKPPEIADAGTNVVFQMRLTRRTSLPKQFALIELLAALGQGFVMAHCICTVGKDGHFTGPAEEVERADDKEAVAVAMQLKNGRARRSKTGAIRRVEAVPSSVTKCWCGFNVNPGNSIDVGSGLPRAASRFALVALKRKQTYERYLALTHAETQNGNTVAAENYYQHAEHYFRSMYSGSSES